jgi:dolichyl-phosphate beta-glucosyltransferase
MQASPKILLVIPSFNDSARLGVFLPLLCRAVFVSDLGIRIQVVDDGSCKEEVSQTQELVERFRAGFPSLLPLLCLGRNRGKGGAVYAGWEQAGDEEWLAFVDADGAIPAEEVLRFCKHVSVQSGFDGLLASRILMLGHTIDRTTKRHIFGRVYATLAKIFVEVPVYDSQCGFKFFKRSSFEQVRPNLETMRFGFDLELLANFHSMGFPLLEMPIRQWSDVPGAKVRLVRDSLEMFVSLWKLRNKMRRKKSWMSSNKNN